MSKSKEKTFLPFSCSVSPTIPAARECISPRPSRIPIRVNFTTRGGQNGTLPTMTSIGLVPPVHPARLRLWITAVEAGLPTWPRVAVGYPTKTTFDTCGTLRHSWNPRKNPFSANSYKKMRIFNLSQTKSWIWKKCCDIKLWDVQWNVWDINFPRYKWI